MQRIELWAEGQDVLNVQCRLAESGFYLGDLDGFFGPRTQAAVIAFQKRKQIDTTGAVDSATAAALGVAETTLLDCEVENITAELIAPMLPEAPLRRRVTAAPYPLHTIHPQSGRGIGGYPSIFISEIWEPKFSNF